MSLSNHFLVVSDIHYANHQPFSRILPDGRNSRLASTQAAVDSVLGFGEQFGVKDVVFSGDWWHTGAKVPTSVTDPVSRQMVNSVQKGFRWHMIPGNHDMASLDGQIHGLSPYKGYENGTGRVEVFDQPTVRKIGRATVTFIPYCRNMGELERHLDNLRPPLGSSHQILVLHTGIAGVAVGSGIVLEVGAIHPSLFMGWQLTISGHYHEHKSGTYPGGEWVIPGSLQQVDFSEQGQKKGFLAVDTERMVWEFREIESPQFLELKYPSEREIIKTCLGQKDVFLKVKAENSSVARTELEELIGEGLSHWVFDPFHDEAEETRIEITPQTSFEEMLRKYIDYTASTDLDKERLFDMGVKFTE